MFEETQPSTAVLALRRLGFFKTWRWSEEVEEVNECLFCNQFDKKWEHNGAEYVQRKGEGYFRCRLGRKGDEGSNQLIWPHKARTFLRMVHPPTERRSELKMHRHKPLTPALLRKQDCWLNQYLIHHILSVASVIGEDFQFLPTLRRFGTWPGSYSFFGTCFFHHLGIVHIVAGDAHGGMVLIPNI